LVVANGSAEPWSSFDLDHHPRPGPKASLWQDQDMTRLAAVRPHRVVVIALDGVIPFEFSIPARLSARRTTIPVGRSTR
jgi:hypothetical protein